MMAPRRLATVILAGGLVLSACAGSAEPDTAPTTTAVVSDLAGCPAPGAVAAARDSLPAHEFPCLGGDIPFTVGDAPGTPTVLNLWAPWCPPCRAELPLFQQLHTAAVGLRVLGLVERDTVASGVAYAHKVGLTFPSGLDADGALMTDQGLNALPATYFLRADGSVAFRQVGPVASFADLQALVARHLGVDVP